MALDLDWLFTHHPPRDDSEARRYERIREAAKQFAKALESNCPSGADLNAAIRHVREATMTANASIALQGRVRNRKRVPNPAVEEV